MRRQKTRIFSVLCGSVVGSVVALGLVTLVGCSATPPTSTNQSRAERSPLTARSVVGDVSKATEASANAPTAKKSVVVAAALGGAAADEARGVCRPGMVSIEGRYCIDRYEASLVEIVAGGGEQPFSPYATISENQHVRAVSAPNVYPQGYINRNQAEQACLASGKRLCGVAEWRQACRGPENKQYGYSERREVGRCNDNGKNPVLTIYGPRYDASTMNQPQLNQMEGTLSKTGAHSGCSNGYGVYDMVGNLHEWVADPSGTFYGGYYQDVASFGHGDGCGYQTTAHEARYHDYSTGFRCCADILNGESNVTVSPAASPPTPVTKSTTTTIAKPTKPLRNVKRRH